MNGYLVEFLKKWNSWKYRIFVWNVTLRRSKLPMHWHPTLRCCSYILCILISLHLSCIQSHLLSLRDYTMFNVYTVKRRRANEEFMVIAVVPSIKLKENCFISRECKERGKIIKLPSCWTEEKGDLILFASHKTLLVRKKMKVERPFC